MIFAEQAGAAFVLVILTLWLESAGTAVLINEVRSVVTPDIHTFRSIQSTAIFVRFTIAMVALHILGILLWASYYRWFCFASWDSAFYFSATNYTTVGCDLSLPLKWRILGPIESVTGVLMCGISVSVLFAIATRLVGPERHFGGAMKRKLSMPSGESLDKRAPSIASPDTSSFAE
jgi:voltage-gated potassium channel